ncbi:aminotransferase class I/II-fold pyridoxal phosphate-dependent enzyme [Amycolatopsis sp. PS_44_ISF1]|uniref:pyridoxal phosphate-dependent decarboxylase family protein n=1 Tax=Amycolatopsis sp. PS_44_ISF1 TaxID=2974917 RepID=UPI0028E08E21|nr:aminotransferase class I/II-fold pyridoxal phosphate-dependent enzyme [Amycolatopsis sp. PS_44_ISF1]MDT8913666.1 aminotransferase class V-fold PLP-dependent enzyme [Amycolatopsis sp. PS_44_ISF1]
MELSPWLERATAEIRDWASSHGPVAVHPSLGVDEPALREALDVLVARLRKSYPFFHPRYAGQMLKPPHPVAVVGYVAAMLINPNNHALDGGPATSALETEAVGRLAAMFGLENHLGHLTSSGTIANLEALFVARECHPGAAVALSTEAHYTHARMCHLLGLPTRAVAADAHGRMDPAALAEVLATGDVGTVVATAGTTGRGAVDPVHEILALARGHGARVHVDAAYGGFFTLLAQDDPDHGPALVDPRPWRALAGCDSLVVDPHKHGLQPYGCGAVLFGDPAVARFYRHDSPYTYFSSSAPHLGEISLECSRSGAAAAALWLTQELLPLDRGGLGAVLAAGRRAATNWARMIQQSPHLELFQPPDLDIVTYFPRSPTPWTGTAALSAASTDVLDRGMKAEDPVYLSTLRVEAGAFAARHPAIPVDGSEVTVLRSVLMKPEAEPYLDHLHQRVEHLVRQHHQDRVKP